MRPALFAASPAGLVTPTGWAGDQPCLFPDPYCLGVREEITTRPHGPRKTELQVGGQSARAQKRNRLYPEENRRGRERKNCGRIRKYKVQLALSGKPEIG